MPPSDLDITRTTHLLIQQHGDDATAKAREKVDECGARATPTAPTPGCGSLGTFRRPPTDAQH
jgi:hypothetical protein